MAQKIGTQHHNLEEGNPKRNLKYDLVAETPKRRKSEKSEGIIPAQGEKSVTFDLVTYHDYALKGNSRG